MQNNFSTITQYNNNFEYVVVSLKSYEFTEGNTWIATILASKYLTLDYITALCDITQLLKNNNCYSK